MTLFLLAVQVLSYAIVAVSVLVFALNPPLLQNPLLTNGLLLVVVVALALSFFNFAKARHDPSHPLHPFHRVNYHKPDKGAQ